MGFVLEVAVAVVVLNAALYAASAIAAFRALLFRFSSSAFASALTRTSANKRSFLNVSSFFFYAVDFLPPQSPVAVSVLL